MAACQRAGEWERVLTLLKQMDAVGYPPDLASYEIVMSACIRSKVRTLPLCVCVCECVCVNVCVCVYAVTPWATCPTSPPTRS